jgi:hypothetical protein
MFSNKLAFTALGAACILAASAGGYFALRQNEKSTTSAAPAVASGPAESASSVGLTGSAGSGSTQSASPAGTTKAANPERPVQETEAVVSRPATATTNRVNAPAPSKTTTPTAPTTPRRAAKLATAEASRPDTVASFDRTWPSGAASAPTPTQAPGASEPVSQAGPRPGETVLVAPEPTPVPEPTQKSYEELVVSADSVIGLQSETTVSSEHARVEDRVEARVTRDVRVGNRVAIPAGSRAIGVVSQVDRGGKFKEHARLAIRFQTVVLADGTRLPVSTDAVIREGSAPSNDSAKKIGGGAVAGTILGAILGGAKGAAIGGMAGAGAGAGAVAAGDRSEATLHAGEPMTIRLLSPVTVTSER